MRTKSPSENIPNFNDLYDVLFDYIKEHQGEKGYINTDANINGADTIYGAKFCEESGIGEERIVFGVRVKNEDIEVLLRPYMRTHHNAPDEEDYLNDFNWDSLRYSDVYFVSTLIGIAECIEEYVEE